MVISPPMAAAQDGAPTPSAKGLWRTYPLQPTPHPATPTPAPQNRTASAPPASADDGGTLGPILGGGAAALIALGAAALLLRRRHGRERAPARIAWAAPLVPAAAAAAIPPAGRPGRPRLTPVASSGSNGRKERRDRAPDSAGTARPPDVQRSWTAEVQWRDDGNGPRFCVVARTSGAGPAVTILSSQPLEWPPADAAAVQRLSNATDRLEAALLTAGWTPLPPGKAWYAKRFAWESPVASAPAERRPPRRPDGERAPALPQDAASPGGRRFKQQAERPEGRKGLWVCSIRWHAGYVNSRFEAVAHDPKSRHKVTIVRSAPFKWMLMADPPPGGTEYAAQVRRLADRLAADGWKPAERGLHWYELRFVWDGDEPPPTHLELAPTEQKGRADVTS